MKNKMHRDFVFHGRDCRVTLQWQHNYERFTVVMNNITVCDNKRFPKYICRPGAIKLVSEAREEVRKYLNGNR